MLPIIDLQYMYIFDRNSPLWPPFPNQRLVLLDKVKNTVNWEIRNQLFLSQHCVSFEKWNDSNKNYFSKRQLSTSFIAVTRLLQTTFITVGTDCSKNNRLWLCYDRKLKKNKLKTLSVECVPKKSNQNIKIK